MKIYQIAGKQYAVIGEELYERLEVGMISARPHDPLADLAPTPLRRKYKTRIAKPKKEGKGPRRGSTHCKVCNGYGHFAKTCPKRDGTLPAEEPETRRPEVTKEQVEELKEKGLNSIQIAAKLKTTLSEVNKHW